MEHCFRSISFYYAIDWFLEASQVAVLMSVSVSLRFNQAVTPFQHFAWIFFIMKSAATEVIELWGLGALRYMSNGWNFFDVLKIVLGFVAAIQIASGAPNRELLALVAMMHWLSLLARLKAVRLFGPRVLPIIVAMRGTASFFFVMAFPLSGFLHMYPGFAIQVHERLQTRWDFRRT